jgi:hypothetical protein
MQTEGVAKLGLPAQNYLVAATQRQVFKTSNLGFIWVNRQDFMGNGFSLTQSYNRVLGADLNIFTKDSRWRGKLFLPPLFFSANEAGYGSHRALASLPYPALAHRL